MYTIGKMTALLEHVSPHLHKLARFNSHHSENNVRPILNGVESDRGDHDN